MYNFEKDIYVKISKVLAEGETIEFELLKGCSSVFILKEGCAALNLKPMTLIIYKPNLLWDSQSRVSESVEDRKDINSAVLIYNTLNHSEISGYTVKPERTIGKMITMSYREFEKLITIKNI